VWLWWAGALPGLSKRAAAEIDSADRIGICTMSCWELATLVRRQRLRLHDDVRNWIARALAVDRVEAVPLDTDIALAAGALDRSFPGDPADRIIYSTARTLDATLLTKDRRLRRYDAKLTLW
jgi:PIN domain nuclease of toxin-antitoxin system